MPNVLAHYEITMTGESSFLDDAGGFSGAEFWKIPVAGPATASQEPRLLLESSSSSTPEPVGWLCLRRWPAVSPDESRLQQIHAFLDALAAENLPVPTPLRTRTGATFVREGRTLWELTAWMPGAADFHANPNDDRLRAAMESLARVHLAAAAWRTPKQQPSAAVRQRFQMLQQVKAWVSRLKARQSALPPTWRTTAAALLQAAPRAASETLARYSDVPRLPLPVQWVVKDIWHDHVLFQNNDVSGIIDFGAIGIDTVATDLARLLGSLLGNDWPRWSAALEAYAAVRPLSSAERETVAALDRAAVVLSGLNWLQWAAVDGRRFPGREADILQRLETLQRRLVN